MNRTKPAVRRNLGCACLLAWLLICANLTLGTDLEFRNLYDYYFPKQGGGVVSSIYRRSFDKELFGPPPKSEQERHPEFYAAFHGDANAVHQFFHNSDRDGGGEFAERWAYECLLLLLRLGDDRFSELLAKEDPATREAVGQAIDSLVDWNKHGFPKTRGLYSYRYVAPTQKERADKDREPFAIAWKGVTNEQWNRLRDLLAKQSRFSRVQVSRTEDGITSITVPRSMSKPDKLDLQQVLRHIFVDTQGVQYY